MLGIGANAKEAYRPWRTDVRGQRITVFAATDVLDDWLIEPWTATDAQSGLASSKPPAGDRLLTGIRADGDAAASDRAAFTQRQACAGLTP